MFLGKCKPGAGIPEGHRDCAVRGMGNPSLGFPPDVYKRQVYLKKTKGETGEKDRNSLRGGCGTRTIFAAYRKWDCDSEGYAKPVSYTHLAVEWANEVEGERLQIDCNPTTKESGYENYSWKVSRLSRMPRCIHFYYQENTETRQAGCLFITPPEDQNLKCTNFNKTAVVGVDFGTTNTICSITVSYTHLIVFYKFIRIFLVCFVLFTSFLVRIDS